MPLAMATLVALPLCGLCAGVFWEQAARFFAATRAFLLFAEKLFGPHPYARPILGLRETVAELGLEDRKVAVPGRRFYWVPIESYGIGALTRGPSQALGNVLVEEDTYTRSGFFFDALISHQYLRHLGSWTIDFDTMNYYFPAEATEGAVEGR